MFNIQKIGVNNNIFAGQPQKNVEQSKTNSLCSNPIMCTAKTNNETATILPSSFMENVSSANLMAYHPSFTAKLKNGMPSEKSQLKTVQALLDKNTQAMLNRLEKKGILTDNSSNDGSTVLENLYKIATEARIPGLSTSQILSETIKAMDNPSSITQKFGDIPDEVASQIEQETGKAFPQNAKNVASSSCVVTSMEYTLASKYPAEFTRFVKGLSSQDYCVDKKVKLSDIDSNLASALWHLREFNTEHTIDKNWEDVTVKIKPDRNAIVRARVQTSYKDKGERSCVDVLIQSALLNLCSQNTYDALTDERTGKFNSDKSGLTDFEKNFGEQIVFGKPKISVVYQTIDENGFLTGYNCELSEMKQHILKSLELGENVIIGYTHLDENKQVNGGHEITITGYREDKQGNGYFICNDTDDDIDELIEYSEDKLLPLIHHAGIPKAALSENDVVVEPWREILDEFQKMLAEERQGQI